MIRDQKSAVRSQRSPVKPLPAAGSPTGCFTKLNKGRGLTRQAGQAEVRRRERTTKTQRAQRRGLYSCRKASAYSTVSAAKFLFKGRGRSQVSFYVKDRASSA